jgi:hypothetical protein
VPSPFALLTVFRIEISKLNVDLSGQCFAGHEFIFSVWRYSPESFGELRSVRFFFTLREP